MSRKRYPPAARAIHYMNPATLCCINCGVTDLALYHGFPLPWSGCQMKAAR